MRRINLKAYKILTIIFLFIVICYSIFTLIEWNIDRKNNIDEIKEIEQVTNVVGVEETENVELVNPPDDKNDDYWTYINSQFIDANIEELKKVNSDTIGFISVSGTNINYPVVQAKDNKYYLEHSFKHNLSKIGWIFVDYRNNLEDLDKNTVIYGHNMLDGTMLGTLKNVLKSKWLTSKDNHIIKLSTSKENTLWQVFSIYKIPTESYYINTNFNNDEEYRNWLNTMIKRSKYNFNTNVYTNDKVLTLSTCYTNSARLVVQAKLIKSMYK